MEEYNHWSAHCMVYKLSHATIRTIAHASNSMRIILTLSSPPFLNSCIINKFIFPYQVGFPQGLAHAVHLFVACAANNEVFGLHRAANQIHRSDVRLLSHRVKTGDHWLYEVWSEAALIKEVGHHVHQRDRLHGTVLSQFVQVLAELQSLESAT